MQSLAPGIVKFKNAIQLSDVEFYKLSRFIYSNYGINLPLAKKTLLESRLQKHLRLSGIPSFKKYVDRICNGEEHEEVVRMINIVSTNKTDFFREKLHFEFMQKEILPAFANVSRGREINVWCAAASSGEEPYTIAMTIDDFLANSDTRFSYKIVATDISTDMLKKGRDAIYHEDRIAPVPMEARKKYFLKSKDRSDRKVRVVKELRDKILFKRFNLMTDNYPVQGSYDIIFCRNVLIYFDKVTREKVIRKLCSSLKSGGYLFLGHSESIFGLDVPLISRQHTCYQKLKI